MAFYFAKSSFVNGSILNPLAILFRATVFSLSPHFKFLANRSAMSSAVFGFPSIYMAISLIVALDLVVSGSMFGLPSVQMTSLDISAAWSANSSVMFSSMLSVSASLDISVSLVLDNSASSDISSSLSVDSLSSYSSSLSFSSSSSSSS